MMHMLMTVCLLISGRTLPKSSCSVAAFEPDVIERVSNAVYQRARNELGWLVRSNETDVQYMVIGYLDTLRQFGAFDDKVFYEFVEKDSSYHISADRLRWLPVYRQAETRQDS